MSHAKFFIVAILCIATVCSGAESLKLASTTSTAESVLSAYLLPLFKPASGRDVKVVAVRTGQALELARRGDADGLLVHDQGPASQRGAGDRECGCGMGRAEHGHLLQSMRADR